MPDFPRHPIAERWLEDPSFLALSPDVRQATLSNFFDDQVANEQFLTLDEETQGQTKNNFLKAHLGFEGPGADQPVRDTEYHWAGAAKQAGLEIARFPSDVAEGIGKIWEKAEGREFPRKRFYDQSLQERFARMEAVDQGGVFDDQAFREKEREIRAAKAHALISFGKTGTDFYDRLAEVSPDIQDFKKAAAAGDESIFTQALGAAGSLGGAVGMSMVPGVGPVLAGSGFFNLNKEETKDAALRQLLKAGVDPVIAEQKAEDVSWTGGAINSLLDTVGAGRIAHVFKPARKLLNFLMGTFITSQIEGTTEGVQGIVTQVSADWASKPESETCEQFISRAVDKFPEYAKNAKTDYLVGSILGGGGHVIGGGTATLIGDTPVLSDPGLNDALKRGAQAARDARVTKSYQEYLDSGKATAEGLRGLRSALPPGHPVARDISDVLRQMEADAGQLEADAGQPIELTDIVQQPIALPGVSELTGKSAEESAQAIEEAFGKEERDRRSSARADDLRKQLWGEEQKAGEEPIELTDRVQPVALLRYPKELGAEGPMQFGPPLPVPGEIRRVDGGAFDTEEKAKAAINRSGKSIKDYRIIPVQSEGGFVAWPLGEATARALDARGIGPYLATYLDQLKTGERGRRIRTVDRDGREEWQGFSSSYPEWFKNQGWEAVKAISALEKGISGRPFAPSEKGTGEADIWSSAIEAAKEDLRRDVVEFARVVENVPRTIEGLSDTDYRNLLGVLEDEGLYTGPVKEAAAAFRKTVEGEAVREIAEEQGFPEEEIRAILEDPTEPDITLDEVWRGLSSEDRAFMAQWKEKDYDREEEGRPPRGKREGEEPRGAVQEPGRGGEAPRAGGVLQEEAAKVGGGSIAPQEGVRPTVIVEGEKLTPGKGVEVEAQGREESNAGKPDNEAIDTGAHEAATSPQNQTPEPSEAQIIAGNYKHGHIKVQGFDISVENPEGSQRTGTSPNGKKWSITMAGHYGYFKRSEGKDGEQVDVFVNAGERKESYDAYVVDQVDPKTGKFDEHKVMLGYPSLEAAKEGYLANYEKGWKGLGNITEVSIDDLKKFVGKRQVGPYGIEGVAEQPAVEKEPDEIFIRPPTKQERMGGTQRKRGYNDIPDKEGYEKVYKPYGVEGRGYYYVKKPSDEKRTKGEDLGNLYDYSISQPKGGKKSVSYGPVTKQEAGRIKDEIGLDVDGYAHTIDSFSIRHIHSGHGDETRELKRGQLPITRSDIANIPEITAKPDHIVDGGKTKLGLDTIWNVKQINGIVYYLEEIRTGRKELAAKTMIKAKAGSAARDVSSRVLNRLNPPSQSSETLRQPIKEKITEKEVKVKPENKEADWIALGYTKPTAASMVILGDAVEHTEGHPGTGLFPWSVKLAKEAQEKLGMGNPFITRATELHKVAKAWEELKVEPTPRKSIAAQPEKIEDFGEKIGGARKDTAERGYAMSGKEKEQEALSTAWQKRFKAIENSMKPGSWNIVDTKSKSRWGGVSKESYLSEEEANKAVPIYAVAQSHRVYNDRETTTEWAIFKSVGKRKLFKVVDKTFPSREEGMKYMAQHAEEILNIKTTFGEEILPVPEIATRTGPERRQTDATPEMFMETFAPRGIEFGNWNNQEERQQVLNHAYDGLLDLAEVLNIPPKALMLDGDLAVAFGARGQGLVGAKAHYERDYGVINLTKMKGAGSLAHEWFHALDHYFARQDTKASSEKEKSERGDLVYKTKSARMDFLSHGASYKSKVRSEIQKAYDNIINTMYKKAEKYVEDTEKADKFVSKAREYLKNKLDSIRSDLEKDLMKTHTWRKNTKGLLPASAEQIAEFDTLANVLIEGGNLEVKFISNKNKRSFKGRHSNETLEAMSKIYKDVRNRTGFSSQYQGPLDKVSAAMRTYAERLKVLEDAKDKTKKTKRVPTSYALEAKKMDQARAGDYWSEPHEMAARAFAAYVEDKIAEQGNQSDFIVYHAHGGILLPMIDGFVARPYPEGKEREAINKTFDDFAKTLETKETDKGTALLSLAPKGTIATLREANPEALEQLRKDVYGWLKDVLPKSALRRLAVELAPEVSLEGRNVSESLKHWAQIKKDRGSIMGAATTNSLSAFIELSYNFDSDTIQENTYHEAFHVATKWLLSENDHKAVMKHFGGNEEAAANAFMEFAVKRKKMSELTLPGKIQMIYYRLRSLLQKIRNALTGKGFTRPEDVFARLWGKEYGMLAEGVRKERVEVRKEELSLAGIKAATAPIATQEFKDKMKGSVVTKTGKPWEKVGDELQVYHGTTQPIDVFSNRITWVSPDPSLASEYAGERAVREGKPDSVMPVYVSAKVLYRVESRPKHRNINQLLMGAVEQAKKNKMRFDNDKALAKLNQIRKYWWDIGLDNSEVAVFEHWNKSGDKGNQLMADFLEILGFDSLTFEENGVETLGILRPGQILTAFPETNITKAERMLAEGKTEQEVWKETGWMKGAEGKWRFEIDDSGAKLEDRKTWLEQVNYPYENPLEFGAKLKDVLDHPELFKAYPGLADIRVAVSGGRGGASYSDTKNIIHIGSNELAVPAAEGWGDNIKTLLLHEIQHAIQGIEGFTRGGSPEGLAHESRMELRYIERDIELAKEKLAMKNALRTSESEAEAADKFETYFGKPPTFTFDSVRHKTLDTLEKELVDLERQAKAATRDMIEASTKYGRLAGEIEARDTAARANLPAAMRGINLKEAREKWQEAQKIKQSKKYRAEEREWNQSDFSKESLKNRNESPAHKEMFALHDEIEGMGYDINNRLILEALSGDKKAQDLLIQMPYKAEHIPRDQWIVKDGEGTSFSVEVPTKEQAPPTRTEAEMIDEILSLVNKNALNEPAEPNILKQQIEQKKRVDRVELNPNDQEAIEEAYGKATFKAMLKPFIRKGKIDTARFEKQTGIKLSSNDPKDLYRWVRKLQTMQDFAKNYPEMAALFDVQERRTGMSNQLSIKDRKTVEPYFTLAGKTRKKVDKALLYGDRRHILISNDNLESKFNLDEDERKGYWAIRKALDDKLQYILGQMVTDALSGRKGTKAEEEIVDVSEVVKAINTRNKARSSKEVNVSTLDKRLAGKLSDLGLLPAEIKAIVSEDGIANWGFERRAYVPHTWATNWVAKVIDEKGREYLFEVPTVLGNVELTRKRRLLMATKKAGQVARGKLGDNVKSIRVIRSRDIPVELFEGASVASMQSIMESATNSVMREYETKLDTEHKQELTDIREKIGEHIQQLYMAKGWGRHLISRKGLSGFREDMSKVIPEYLTGFNAYVAKGKAAREFAEAMKDIDPTKTPEMWKAGKEYISDMLGDTSEAGWFKKLAGTYFLAADISAATLNMTQNWTHAVPLLKGIKGKETAERAISRAMRDVAHTYFSSKARGEDLYAKAGGGVTQEEVDALRQAFELGRLDPQFFGEVTGMYKPKIYQSYANEAQQLIFKLFTGVESWNRMSTFLAAYRRAKDAGLADPGKVAADITKGAHFSYGKGNRPELIRKMGAIGNVAYTFMTYPVNNIVFVKHRIENLVRAGTKEERLAAMKVLGANLAYVFAFGGLAALPFGFLAKLIWDLFTDPDDDWEKKIYETVPKPIARGITGGIPKIFGNDMSWRVEGTDILGAPIGFQTAKTIGKRFERGYKALKREDYLDAFFMATPDFLLNPYKALMADQGSGIEGKPPIEYTPGEKAWKALGFTPTRESETWKAAEIARRKKEDRLDKLESFAERYIRIAKVEDPKKKRKDYDALVKDYLGYYNAQAKKGYALMSWENVVESAKRRYKMREKGYETRLPKYMWPYQSQVRESFGLNQGGPAVRKRIGGSTE